MHKALCTWIVGISSFGEANHTCLFSVKRFDGYSWIANPLYMITTPMSYTAFWWHTKGAQHDSDHFMLNVSFKIGKSFLLRLSAAVGVTRILNLQAEGVGYIKIPVEHKFSWLTTGKYPSSKPPPFPDPFQMLLSKNAAQSITGCTLICFVMLPLSLHRMRGRKHLGSWFVL